MATGTAIVPTTAGGSLDRVFHAARSGVSAGGPELDWITDKLAEALSSMGDSAHPEPPAGTCPLNDIGSYLIRVLHIITQFSGQIAHGTFVHDYANTNMTLLVEQDDGSITDYLDEKHQTLKSLADQLALTLSASRQIWASSPHPPCPLPMPVTTSPESSQGARQLSLGTDSASNMDLTEDNVSETPRAGSSTADMTTEAQDEDDVPSLSQLKARGSGAYTCPEGMSCKRGGVVDGRLKVFKRNSDFRTHLLRHERVYRCDLPGCPNKKGFARPDQLERHKRDVKHHSALTWTETKGPS